MLIINDDIIHTHQILFYNEKDRKLKIGTLRPYYFGRDATKQDKGNIG